MLSKKQLQISLLLLSITALFPFVIICFYALPFADDFCFGWTASEKIAFVQKFLNQYLYWNGRYTADVLVNFHPLVTGKNLVYQLSTINLQSLLSSSRSSTSTINPISPKAFTGSLEFQIIISAIFVCFCILSFY